MAIEAKKILILDDSEFALEIARTALEKAGYAVTTVGTVVDFEKVLPRVKPDAIITDIIMPEIYVDDFKKNLGIAGIPVVLFSDLNEAELKKIAQSSGANGFVCKSWGPEKLVEAMKKILPIT